MKDALVLDVLRNFRFERCEVGQYIAVCEDYPTRFGGGSGSKNDLADVIAIHCYRRIGRRQMPREIFAESFQSQTTEMWNCSKCIRRANQQLRVNLRGDTTGKIRRRNPV